jgi:hypothetical protein
MKVPGTRSRELREGTSIPAEGVGLCTMDERSAIPAAKPRFRIA